jgi:hypothetical protein
MTVTFGELWGRWVDCPAHGRSVAFGSLPQRDQDACWEDLAEQCRRWTDAEYLLEQRRYEELGGEGVSYPDIGGAGPAAWDLLHLRFLASPSALLRLRKLYRVEDNAKSGQHHWPLVGTCCSGTALRLFRPSKSARVRQRRRQDGGKI